MFSCTFAVERVRVTLVGSRVSRIENTTYAKNYKMFVIKPG